LHKVLLLSVFILLLSISALSQGGNYFSPGGSQGITDYHRRQELITGTPSPTSLLQQNYLQQFQQLDSLLPFPDSVLLFKAKFSGKNSSFQLLPFSLTVGYNTHHPFGWNDGSMIPAKGLQTLVSGGILWKAGKFSLQLMPQLVYASNPHFETFPTEHFDGYWATYYRLLNNIDMPERFNTVTYKKILPGQSAIRYQLGAISVGISTENYWWGPGRYNALVLSNNAQGFLHFTANTTRPIHTRIGDFEGQIIAGQLQSSGIFPADTNRYFNGVRLYKPKQEANRYMTGLTINWQPKWVKGLYLGVAQASYQYASDVSGIADMLPLAGIVVSATQKAGKKAALGSVFARYVLPKDHAEFYLEYGRNDRVPTPINLIADVNYPRAFVGGFRKLFPLKKKDTWLELATEFTQMGLPTPELVLEGNSFYTHPYVRQGYTHNGQVLGAGIGPGSNSQTIDVSWVKGFNKVGLRIERLARNMDFNYAAFIGTRDYTRHWIDISTELHADWQYQNILFSARTTLTRSLNYQWYVFPDLGYFQNGYDFLNFNATILVAYRF
jgi:hypothetical protein